MLNRFQNHHLNKLANKNLNSNHFLLLKDETFEEGKFLGMIVQVQDKICDLVIGTGQDRDYYVGPIPVTGSFRLPYLPNLESLVIDGIQSFNKIGPDLNSRLLPKLKCISLLEKNEGAPVTMEEFLSSINPSQRIVEKLRLQFIKNVSSPAIRRMGRLWPNVTQLTVYIKPSRFPFDENFSIPDIIQPFFSCWEKLGQFHAEIQVGRHSARHYTAAIKSLAGFSGWTI